MERDLKAQFAATRKRRVSRSTPRMKLKRLKTKAIKTKIKIKAETSGRNRTHSATRRPPITDDERASREALVFTHNLPSTRSRRAV